MNECLELSSAEPPTAASERVREHYDRLAFLYRLFWGEHLHHGLFRSGAEKPGVAQLELIRYCASLARVQCSWDVLDVGCGYGATAIYFADHYRCRCTGLTVSAIQATLARQRSLRAGTDKLVQFVLCDAETQPLGLRIYDLLWIVEASEHFVDRAYFFKRAARALREGGRLLLTCWTVREQTSQLQQVANLCACREFQTINAYVSQISDTGLRIIHCEELTQRTAVTWDIVQRRIQLLMPTLRLWPTPIREFARAIGSLRTAFHSRELQYWIVIAHK